MRKARRSEQRLQREGESIVFSLQLRIREKTRSNEREDSRTIVDESGLSNGSLTHGVNLEDAFAVPLPRERQRTHSRNVGKKICSSLILVLGAKIERGKIARSLSMLFSDDKKNGGKKGEKNRRGDRLRGQRERNYSLVYKSPGDTLSRALTPRRILEAHTTGGE